MNCPRCNSAHKVKDGIVKARQRYQCKGCMYRYTVEQIGKPDSLKKNAIHLYLEGLGFRSIERILPVSHVTVMNWVKKLGKQVEELRAPDKEIDIIEMDELHTYIQSKKTIAGSGLLLIDLDTGSLISCWVRGGVKPGNDSIIR